MAKAKASIVKPNGVANCPSERDVHFALFSFSSGRPMDPSRSAAENEMDESHARGSLPPTERRREHSKKLRKDSSVVVYAGEASAM